MLLDSINMYTWIWLFLIVFMLHDFEEIITVETWLTKNKTKVLHRFPSLVTRYQAVFERRFAMKTAQFSFAVAWIFVLLSVITFYTSQTLAYGGSFLFYVAALHVLFGNVWTHVIQSVVLRGYTPGVVTAVILALPYTLYMYSRLLAEGYITWSLIWIAVPLSIVLLPVVFFGLLLGRKCIS
ncbi:HXXEE domain-containing protein [Aneurinibacillus sp. REN35]|uniref:HXXEE domain-containing protein n=1 Tax=Aneurinibacillus sp. REN35 TaxID=3237286 RepID=UPI0035295E02